jgi:hypothetical protein
MQPRTLDRNQAVDTTTDSSRVNGAGAQHSAPEPLLRWGGLLAVFAAALATPAWIASVFQEDPVSSWPIIATMVALLLAIPAIFAAQASFMGQLGRIAVVLMMVGGMFEVAGMTTVMVIQAKVGLHGHEQFIMSGSVAPHMLALSALGVLFYLGVVLFGIATERARIFPRRAGLVTAAGSVVMVAGSLPDITGLVAAGAVLLFCGFAWMGWQLWRPQTNPLSA